VGRLLEGAWTVQAVADGEAALAAVRKRRPDLVLADVMMPRLDGFQLLRAIRADPTLRDLPVVLLSARAGEESRIEGLAAGADDYLVKPFSARELVARVSANLELDRVRRQGTEALRESERRYRTLVAASSDVVYRMSPDWSEMRHLLGREIIADTRQPSSTWLQKYIHADDQPAVTQAINEAIRTRSVFELEHRVIRIDGSLGWVHSRAVPLLDSGENITEWIGAAVDISQHKLAEAALQQRARQLKLMVDELNHRVKNTLASVQSIAMQTLRNSSTAAEGRHSLEARLLALAKAHDVLTREHWEGASLKELLTDALSAYTGNGRHSPFDIEGAEIRLFPRATLALSMALHELATNAVKYGALSSETGRVRIQWEPAPGKPCRFRFQWVESGGPPVRQPGRRGFGSRLIQQGLAHDLGGDVQLHFAHKGLVCVLEAPLGEICGRTEW
jgi:two-component sensor histidine kinase/PAS domain-containing protein